MNIEILRLITAADGIEGLLVEGLTDTQNESWSNKVDEFLNALADVHKTERMKELLEKQQDFILAESVFADDHPSWMEVAEANAEAESRWNETDEGKELKALLDD